MSHTPEQSLRVAEFIGEHQDSETWAEKAMSELIAIQQSPMTEAVDEFAPDFANTLQRMIDQAQAAAKWHRSQWED